MDTPKWNIQMLRERNVYEPSEDTFLLLDALEEDLNNIRSSEPRVILEIGSGSGVIISAMASTMREKSHCIAVDIHPAACSVTRDTAKMNGVYVDVVNANLLKTFNLRGTIDMIIFNPPYVETEDEETFSLGIAQSWAGGVNGRKILNELLPCLNQALSLKGTFYLVAISYNDIDDLEKRLKNYGFDCITLQRRQILGELLFVLKFTKVIEI